MNDKLSQPASAILVTSDPREAVDRNGKSSEVWLLPEEAVPALHHAVRNAWAFFWQGFKCVLCTLFFFVATLKLI